MKLWKIFCYEFTYQLQRLTTWLYLAVLLLFTIVMGLLITPGDGVFANNTFHITAITVIGGIIWLLIGASIAGEAASRDVQTRMHSLIYSTSVNKRDYLGGRFLAAFALNALLIFALPLGILLSFYLPGLEQKPLQPFRPFAYLSVFFYIALPSAFVATALQFSLAALSRQVMASYMGSLLLALVAQVVAIAVAKLFGNWDLVKLLDPVGVTGIISNELATWTPTEKNTRLLKLEGMFLWNRVLWMGVALGTLWLTYHRFSFTNPATNNWWQRLQRWTKAPAQTFAETTIVRNTAIKVTQVQRNFDIKTYLFQALTIAWASFWKIARNPVGLTLVGAIVLVSVVFSNRILTQFGIPLLPTTSLVLDYLTGPLSDIGSPWVVIPLLIIYFAGELVWHERETGISDIADAAPVPEWVRLIGKLLGLGIVILLWIVLLLTGGILMQLSLGYHKLEIGLYLQVLFGLQLIDYLLFALLALVVHVVVNKKFIGYLVMLLVFIFIAFPSIFKVEHPMLIFGADPGWAYTDMRGFGATLWPWFCFKLYWIAWALLLALTAKLLWTRGREQSLKKRLQLAKRHFTSSTKWVAIIGVILLLTVGSFNFYNTNVLNRYQTGSNLNEQKAEYERTYSRYSNKPQPQLTATRLHFEIYPDQQQIKIGATYTLVNKDTIAIDSIHFGNVPGIAVDSINFNRPAIEVLADKEKSFYIYALQQPLQPGDSLQLNFAVHYKQQGFRHTNVNTLVVDNGTYFTNLDLLPSIGYLRIRELNNPVLRKKYKLNAHPALPSLYDTAARKKSFTADNATFEAVVGTAMDEVAVAPGALRNTWTTGSRRYFHYKTEKPIGGEYAFSSGNYVIKESKWNSVAIRIYHHPAHAQNVGRMLRSIKASLAYFTEQFGAYPYEHFTLVERAGNGGGASADASIVSYGEQYALMNPDDSPDGFDLPYYISAHEVAHQWWGMARLTPANVEGAGVLIEGLAVYAGMQVLEKNYGAGHLQQYINYLHASYEMPRSLATPSLLQANESFLYYRKGGLAMYALSKYISKEKVNGALRNLLQQHTAGTLPKPTTLDLFKEIHKVTPDSLHYLLNDLFKTNTYWRLKTKHFAVEKMERGQWLVTLKVQAQKVIVDSTGLEKELPMNDWLEVGLYEKGKGLNEPLYLQMHRIKSGEQIIKLMVPRKPERGGIDPNALMIDLRLDDNIIVLSD